jgi:hypothetical protein
MGIFIHFRPDFAIRIGVPGVSSGMSLCAICPRSPLEMPAGAVGIDVFGFPAKLPNRTNHEAICALNSFIPREFVFPIASC